jgi:hypothetical protein
MKGSTIFSFVFVMWILIIIGGGILITIISPISIDGFITIASLRLYYVSMVKAVIAIILVVIWIYVLSKIKNWMFQKQIRH